MTGEPGGPCTIAVGHQPVMGTHLELQLTAATEAEARAAEAVMVAEAMRLQGTFSVFEPESDLCRWRSGDLDEPTPELALLLELAARWQHWSGGSFNPMAGVLTDRWLRAEREGIAPSTSELSYLAASIAVPRFVAVDGGVERLSSCAELDLNAIAKGHVVDLIAQQAVGPVGLPRVVVNAGGDLVHRGAGSVRVAVEDPHRAYDNAAPLARIEVADAAVATSGAARRWFAVAGDRFSRVLDPRSGRPVGHGASATVVAPDAATADVLATVTSVLSPPAAVSFIEALGDEGVTAACLVVDRDGGQHRSSGWAALER